LEEQHSSCVVEQNGVICYIFFFCLPCNTFPLLILFSPSLSPQPRAYGTNTAAMTAPPPPPWFRPDPCLTPMGLGLRNHFGLVCSEPPPPAAALPADGGLVPPASPPSRDFLFFFLTSKWVSFVGQELPDQMKLHICLTAAHRRLTERKNRGAQEGEPQAPPPAARAGPRPVALSTEAAVQAAFATRSARLDRGEGASLLRGGGT